MTAPLVELSDVISQLHQVSSNDENDLAEYLDAASQMIVDMCLPLQPAVVTENLNGGTATVVLSQWPVTSVVSVTTYDALGDTSSVVEAGGTTGLTDGWLLESSAGVLRRIGYYRWPAGFGNISVQYTVGPDSVPPNVSRACVILTQSLWDSRQIPGSSRRGAPAETYTPEFEIPPRVYELLRDYLKPPRVA